MGFVDTCACTNAAQQENNKRLNNYRQGLIKLKEPLDEFEVQPIVIRKTPKFPTRERHMAIRRKKSTNNSFICCGRVGGGPKSCCHRKCANE